jgi:hypothetical protein
MHKILILRIAIPREMKKISVRKFVNVEGAHSLAGRCIRQPYYSYRSARPYRIDSLESIPDLLKRSQIRLSRMLLEHICRHQKNSFL